MRLTLTVVGLAGAIASSLAFSGEMIVQDAVQVNDGSTRLVSCQNTKGLFVIYQPIHSEDAFVVRTDLQRQKLSDVLASIVPNGWTVRYVSPGVEAELINLRVSTYWVDGLKVLASDFNLFVLVNGEKRELLIGRV